MPKVKNGKNDGHSHLHVRSNGVIYTTAADLLSDPDVRKDIKRTTEVMKKVRDRKLREREEAGKDTE